MGRFNRRKERLVNQAFESESGLTMKTFHALHLIAGGCVQPGEIVTELGIPNSTATRLLDTLVAEGLIRREPKPEDLRQLRLSLTPAGKSRYQTAWAQYLTCLHQGFGDLPEASLQQAVAALYSLEQALGGDHQARTDHNQNG